MNQPDNLKCLEIALCLINERRFYEDTRDYREMLIKRINKQCYIESLAIKGLDIHIKSAIKTPWFCQWYWSGLKLTKDERAEISSRILTEWLGDYLLETPQPSEDEIQAKLKRVKAMLNRGAKFTPIGS